MSAPRPRRPSTTVAMRSDSLSAQLLRALARPSRPRRSSPAARRAAARRSPAAPRPAVTRGAAQRAVGDLELAQRLGVGAPPSRAPPGRRAARAPMRSQDAEEADPRPVRRHPLDRDARAGHEHRGGGVEGGRGRVAGDVDRVEREPSPAADASRGRRRGARRRPARSSRRSVWSRLGSGSTTVVVPSASSPASSTQLLICAEATGSAYSIPRSGRAVIVERREAALARVELRRPSPRAGAAMRSTGRRRMLASPSSVQRPPSGWPASQPGSSRSSVPALPTSIAAPGARAAQARAADDELAAARAPRRARRAPHGGERGARVGRVEVVRDVDGLRAHRAEQRGAVRERLVRRRRRACRAAAAPGRKVCVHARATGRPSPATSASACAARSSPAIHRAMCPRSGRAAGYERHVDDVDAAAAERERDLGDDARAGWGPRRAARAPRRRRGRPRAGGGGPRARRRSRRRPRRRRRPPAPRARAAAAPSRRRSRRSARRRWRGRCRARSPCWRPPRA